MKKQLLSAVSLTLVLAASTACGAGTASQSGTDTTSSGETEPQTEPTRIDELGEHDFGGSTFVILDQNDINSNCPVEEFEGDRLNDTIYERSRTIEDLYNVKFDYVFYQDQGARSTAVRNSVLAGDQSCDLLFSILPNALGTLAIEGVMADLCSIEQLSLDREWWSPLLYDSVRLGGKMYYSTGDISPISYRSATCFYANQKLLADYQISAEEIYDHVENGTWTFDVLHAYAGDLDRDLNGDDAIVMEDDFLGIGNENGDIAAAGLFCAVGLDLSSIGKDGNLYFDLTNEAAVNAVEKLKSVVCKAIIRDKNNFHTAFKEDRIVFFMHYGSSGYTRYRDMSSEYMILPVPKIDEKQETYRSLMNTWMNCFVGVPKNADTERAGVIMEAMAYWSHENLRAVSFDMALKEKGARNDRDAAMMDIIADTLYLDFNSYMKFGGSVDVLIRAIFSDAPYVSSITAIEDAIRGEADKFAKNWVNGSAS